MDFFNEELGLKIPGHVAVILDGNGRWAKQRKMPRTYGHKVGSQVVEDMLLDFCASWCGPCQMLLPVIEELSNEVTDAKICKINVDEESSLAEKYGVMSIPTLVVVKDGRTVSTSVGVQPKDKILEMLK